MKLLILTGPPAAGKNTISKILAQRKEHCAVIDVDVVRWMILQPHRAPWEGEDGHQQQLLGVRNSCLLAKEFLAKGYDVVILDVLSYETAELYRTQLSEFSPTVVLLLPTLEVIHERNKTRPPWLKLSEIEATYKLQTEFTDYDTKIDNSSLTAEEVADKLSA